MPLECSRPERLAAEQRHIDRLRSWHPDCGFNILPAVWDGDSPGQQAGRQWRAELTRATNKRQAKKEIT
jgi:hypothetical protein